MAQAFEIAWICGYRITGLVPKSFAIDHIEFLHPIEVGSVLQFRAQVVFVDPVRKLALVNAKAFVENPLTGDRLLTVGCMFPPSSDAHFPVWSEQISFCIPFRNGECR